ncbi:MAG: DUF4339 domain-containing protein [Chthoniobacteraceae bacterium]|nr:DUF4339 domain-containing protein [Chthoniobacteraceae bacterium]
MDHSASGTAKTQGLFLALDGRQSGPFDSDQIREMWNQRKITSQTLCWQEGLPSWVPFEKMAGSLGICATVPPLPSGPVPPPLPPLPPSNRRVEPRSSVSGKMTKGFWILAVVAAGAVGAAKVAQDYSGSSLPVEPVGENSSPLAPVPAKERRPSATANNSGTVRSVAPSASQTIRFQKEDLYNQGSAEDKKALANSLPSEVFPTISSDMTNLISLVINSGSGAEKILGRTVPENREAVTKKIEEFKTNLKQAGTITTVSVPNFLFTRSCQGVHIFSRPESVKAKWISRSGNEWTATVHMNAAPAIPKIPKEKGVLMGIPNQGEWNAYIDIFRIDYNEKWQVRDIRLDVFTSVQVDPPVAAPEPVK